MDILWPIHSPLQPKLNLAGAAALYLLLFVLLSSLLRTRIGRPRRLRAWLGIGISAGTAAAAAGMAEREEALALGGDAAALALGADDGRGAGCGTGAVARSGYVSAY